MKVQNISNQNFKAIPLAQVKIKGISEPYKLFGVTVHDSSFLQKLVSSINLKNLMPNLTKEEYEAWEHFFKRAAERGSSQEGKTIIESYNDKFCGILNYTELPNGFYVNHVVTVPDKESHRVPCAGQILFNELFYRLIGSKNAKKIELQAYKQSPFSPISKYLKLGFYPSGGSGCVELMRIFINSIKETLEKQKEFILRISIADKSEETLDYIL
ncbi:hypothetical protein IJ750_04010 [bacterium]|nr:hypothetical protein [bacterium]